MSAPASQVTQTSGCLTIGSNGQLAVVVRLVDTAGQPVTGATVTLTSAQNPVWVEPAMVEVASPPGTYYRTMRAPATTGAAQAIVFASVSWCAANTPLNPPLIISLVGATPFGGFSGAAPDAVGSCAAVQGNVRARVVAAETGAPIEGASVLIGSGASTPYVTSAAQLFPTATATGANWATTNDAGVAEFTDFGSTLNGVVTVTAGAPGRAYVTHHRFTGADQIFALPLRRPPPDTQRFTNGGALPVPPRPDCTYLGNGFALADTTLSQFSHLELGKLLGGPGACVNAGSLGTFETPENVVIPTQTFGATTGSCGSISASWAKDVRAGNRIFTMPFVNTPLTGLLGGWPGVISQSTFASIGYQSVNVTGPVAGSTFALADSYPVNVTFTYSQAPANTDVIAFTLLDFAGGNGFGRIGVQGIGMHRAGVPGNTVTVPVGTTFGAPNGPHHLGTLVALALDAGSLPADLKQAKVAAYVRNGIGPAGTPPFGSTADAGVNVSNFMARTPAVVTDGGTVFTFGDATSVTQTPTYSVSTLTIRRQTYRPPLGCQLGPDLITADYPQWIIYRVHSTSGPQCSALSTNPAQCERFGLPVLPPGFPQATSGLQQQSGFEAYVGSGQSCGTCASSELCQVPVGTSLPARCMGSDGTSFFTEQYTWVLENLAFLVPQTAPVSLPQADFTSFPVGMSSGSTNTVTW